ncbi:MAG: glycine cleavage system aminomethyltransferase GcvT [Spirochaetales bacterium]|nr:glycine cleavage system aminomethyltransferase GcvT [Spirochaetales bacterium]
MSARTALYDLYAAQQGTRLVDFGGWTMPLSFDAGIIQEHLMVRNRAGLFDVSHMGEFMIEGPGASAFADYLLTNRVEGKKDGSCIYSPMCYENGGTVDDLMVYLASADRLMLVVNAANIEKDAEWIRRQIAAYDSSLSFSDISAKTSLLALQGPDAAFLLGKLTDDQPGDMKPFTFRENFRIAGMNTLVSRTGYTGEDGFEIYLANADVVSLWKLLLHEYSTEELLPCGLGCRDTLRLEAALPLYGNDLSAEITPLEAGLNRFVHPEKNDFIGKKALQEKSPQKRLYGCIMKEKGVPRHGSTVLINGSEAGYITSGSAAPSLGGFVALALLGVDSVSIGDEVIVLCSGKEKRAEISQTPFYRRK